MKERTCLGCRRKGDQDSFFRVSRDLEGRVVVFEGGARLGRSGYVCQTGECIEAGLSKDRLARALRTKIAKEELEEISNVLRQRLSD